MDVGTVSMIMSQSAAQSAASMAVMKMALGIGKGNAAQMTDMMKNVSLDPSLGQHLDVSA